MTTDLIPSVSLDALLQKRGAMVLHLEEAHHRLQEVDRLGGDDFDGPDLEDRRTRTYFTEADALPRFIRAIDAQFWDHLLTKSGLWTFMDSTARATWRQQISDGNVPELTRSNVEATFTQLHGTRIDMLERGVIAMFRALSWDYKTNTPRKLGKRVVLERAAHFYNRSTKARWCSGVEFEAANKLDDMVRVFHVLDGKPEPDHRTGASHTLNAAQWPTQTKDVELHGVLRVRGFFNGNAHITFLRPDLVDRCNQIIAKHHPNALPPKEG